MDTEKTGEPVFTNIDKILAEKIISRSKENSRESTPNEKQTVNETYTVDEPRASIPIKWLIAAAAITLLVIVTFLRKSKKI
ncbi:MAG: hypothetical protein LBI42_03815 [Chitinispirillales bacterium]|jgi:hypothetical protein|nr:hypothetical protein [Chitinispirillales bacterium]